MARNEAARIRQGKSSKTGKGVRSAREVGQYGNTRPREDKSVRRARMLENSGRHLRAKEETDKALRKLEQLEAELAAQPAQPTTAPQTAPVVSIHVNREVAQMQRGKEGWTMRDARLLVLDGYSAEHVTAYTGWGRHWLADLLDEDGYVRGLTGTER